MGMSETAHLYFGVAVDGNPLSPNPFDEEGQPDEYYDWAAEHEEEDDLGEYLARRAGLKNPWDDVPHNISHGSNEDYKSWKKDNPEHQAMLDKWYKDKNKLEESVPVSIDVFGHYEYDSQVRILALKGKEFYAWAGDVQPLAMEEMVVTDEEIEVARKFCEENGLPEFKDPAWLLCASYG